MRDDLRLALGLAAWRFLEPVDIDVEIANRSRQRQCADYARRFSAWQRADSPLQLIEEGGDSFAGVVPGRRNRDPHRDDAIGIETEIDLSQRIECPDHQPGTDDEDDGKGYF